MTHAQPAIADARRPIVAMLASESSVYGVVLVSGLLVILADQSDTPPAFILLKVLGTAVVFWLAHVYAGTVAHLGDEPETGEAGRGRLASAIRQSAGHLWGMLLAPIVPAAVLGASLVAPITQEQAIWATLWVNAGLLAVLGYGEWRWSSRIWIRLTGALITAAFGLALVVLKVLIH